MSSGDIDNVLGPEGRLERLRAEYPDLDEYLTRAFRFEPCRAFFILYGAGISSNGQRPYISYDIQSVVNGRECGPALVRHEVVEWGLREFCGIGEDYLNDPEGHRLANRAEAEHVAEILAMPLDEAWDLYSEIVDPQVVIDERQNLEGKPVPRDLAMYPYDEGQQDALREAMGNDRSLEEWAKLTGQIEPEIPPELLPEAERPKVNRSAFLYMEGESPQFAQCGTCTSFVPDRQRCMWFGEDFEVDADDSCGLYINDEPHSGGVPLDLVDPKDAGFYDGPVRCENCVAFYRGKMAKGHCELFETLNWLLPSKFELDELVSPRGCCNAFDPKEP